MDPEIQNFIEVWISAIASLTYCYYVSFNIPKGKLRFVSLLPVFYLLTTLPMNLTTISLGGSTAFFLTWLANFKLLLFAFGQGPLSSNPSVSLFRFVSIACLPIRITDDPFHQTDLKKDKTTQIGDTPLTRISTKVNISPLNLATKCLLLGLLTLAYQNQLYPNLIMLYCGFCMYLGLEVMVTLVAIMAGVLIGVELEPQFNEPYLATSLQDFWGRRWNLAVTNILRPTVYQPTRRFSAKVVGSKGASLVAVFATFVVSGLMHELIYYYLGRVSPTWEVTSFFLLQGACLVAEIAVKRALKGSWTLHWLVSMPLTVGFVMVTGFLLFFPPMMRCKADVRASNEIIALVNSVKNLQWVYNWGSTYLAHKIYS